MTVAADDSFVRIGKIIGPNGLIPISRTSFYKGIKEGRYPKPVKLGPRVAAWRLSEIMTVIRQDEPND